jgi:hypothetical protein
MHGFFTTLGWGLAALVFVSVLVALVEYLREVSRPPQPLPPPGPARAVHVDVDLAALPAPGDQDERQAALDATMAKAARPAPDTPWIETSPMVLAPRQETTAG